MNFSAVSNSGFGRMIRKPLRLIPDTTVIPILQGPARGMRWVTGSATHGCWLGSYENEKQKLMERLVGRGDVVYDIGAHAGFLSLVSSRLVGADGLVIAFEPFGPNLRFLERHCSLNAVSNVRVIPAAVSDRSGYMKFAQGGNSATGCLSVQGELCVKCVELDGFAAQEEVRPPDVLKIDVEGAEVNVIRGATLLLREKRPRILLATHSEELREDCVRMLSALSYRVEVIGKDRHELVALPM